MNPAPDTTPKGNSCNKMKDKILFITGADSGIGKACALLFAKEGADVAIVYLNEHDDTFDNCYFSSPKNTTAWFGKADAARRPARRSSALLFIFSMQ